MNQEIDYQILEDFLNNSSIPVINTPPKTFLEIARQPHYENVISNIYAFFLNPEEEHGMEDLFLSSLLELLKDKITSNNLDLNQFTDFTIETEYTTSNGGRIDLLLYNDTHAIIIENKVYHYLDNDLDDYWQSVTEDGKTAIGVLLSLNPISEDQLGSYSDKEYWIPFENKDEFISITHLDLVKKIKDKSMDRFFGAPDRYRHFLEDFLQNLENISNPTMKEKDINFFVSNKAKINELIKFKYSFKSHIISEIEKVAYAMPNVILDTPRKTNNNVNRLRYYRSTINNDLVYTILFEELLTDKGVLKIIIEPQGKALKNKHIFKKIDFSDNEKKIFRESFYEDPNQRWSHFANNHYKPSSEQIQDLSSFIREKIANDGFESLMKKLEKVLNTSL